MSAKIIPIKAESYKDSESYRYWNGVRRRLRELHISWLQLGSYQLDDHAFALLQKMASKAGYHLGDMEVEYWGRIMSDTWHIYLAKKKIAAKDLEYIYQQGADKRKWIQSGGRKRNIFKTHLQIHRIGVGAVAEHLKKLGHKIVRIERKPDAQM